MEIIIVKISFKTRYKPIKTVMYKVEKSIDKTSVNFNRTICTVKKYQFIRKYLAGIHFTLEKLVEVSHIFVY